MAKQQQFTSAIVPNRTKSGFLLFLNSLYLTQTIPKLKSLFPRQVSCLKVGAMDSCIH